MLFHVIWLTSSFRAGTFSSVYKAVDERHHQYDNKLWCRTCKDADKQLLPTPDPSSSNGRDAFASRAASKRKREDADDGSSETSIAPPTKHRAGKEVYVAIKRIYVTSSPQRIHNELEILHILRYVH